MAAVRLVPVALAAAALAAVGLAACGGGRHATRVACAVSKPGGPRPPRIALQNFGQPMGKPSDPGWYGNGTLWTALPFPHQSDPTAKEAHGEQMIAFKVPWFRASPGQVTITARPAGGPAAPFSSSVGSPAEYGRLGFAPSIMKFGRAGCWHIAARLAGRTLVVTVTIPALPPGRRINLRPMTATRIPPAAPAPATSTPAARPARPLLVAGLVLFGAAVLWGGYSHRWSWTGINGHTATLWDWLHLLLLPLAVGVLPIWMSRRTRIGRPHKSVGFGLLATFSLLVLVGYVIPWAWTGFVGNTLWDWLELLALPLAVALAPVCRELRADWNRRHTLILAGLVGALLIAALGGYLGGWRWTGFKGNTLWDWLHLLLLPLLIPTVVVPALMPVATAGMVELDEEEAGSPPARAG